MNLRNRYQLSESLTTGVVETFRGRDTLTNDQVLIYVFECAAQPSNVPTIEWVLQAFNKIAPPPKELVVNAGRYAGTAFVYLVTKAPEPAGLEQWLASYRCYGSETQEIPAIPSVPGKATDSPKRSDSPDKNETKVIRTGESNNVPSPSAAPTRTFTSFFRSGCSALEQAAKPEDRGSNRPDLSLDHSSTTDKRGPESARLDPPTSVFPSPTASVRLRREPGAPTGEFTRFFKGPFSGEPSPDIPVNLCATVRPQADPGGEFTKIFGSVGNQEIPASHTPTESLSLTKIFAEPAPPPAGSDSFPSVPNSPVSAGEEMPVSSIKPAVWERPPATTPALDSTASRNAGAAPAGPRQGPIAREASNLATYDKDNATRLFSPGREPEAAVPAGPSEYTRIVSRPTPPPEPHAQDMPKPEVAKPGFSIPPVPVAPPLQAPQMPGMTPLAPIPSISAPATQPPAHPAPKPAVSYWPLMLTMTVLFFMAVLLVMYFVLKH